MTIDYLIIGQGLAGSLLAWQLQQQGCRLVIIDNASVNAASRIAAGLITPITGKRLVKSPDLDLFLHAAKDCYQQIEHSVAESFYHARPIIRVLQSNEEFTQYQKRANDEDYHSYLGNYEANLHNTPNSSTHGSVEMNQGGFLNSALLVEKLDDFFMQQGVSRRANVNYADITIDSDRVHWQDITAKHLIFCEGYNAINNPWFNWLPFTPTKGEILQCKIDTPIPDTIIHAGKWLLPLTTNTFRCGATYDWNNLDLQPTQQARAELLAAAKRFFPTSQIDVINHQVGIRPGTRDRQAFIGQHPEHKPLFIFNGFGSKGALTIPYYSKQFGELISGQSSRIINADIARYH